MGHAQTSAMGVVAQRSVMGAMARRSAMGTMAQGRAGDGRARAATVNVQAARRVGLPSPAEVQASERGRLAAIRRSPRAQVRAVNSVVRVDSGADRADRELQVRALKDDLAVGVLPGLRLEEQGRESLTEIHRERRAEESNRRAAVNEGEDNRPWEEEGCRW